MPIRTLGREISLSKNFLPEKVKCKTCGFIRPLDKLGFVSSGDLCCRKCGSKDVILLYHISKGQQ
jgi:ribosomal protein L37E